MEGPGTRIFNTLRQVPVTDTDVYVVLAESDLLV